MSHTRAVWFFVLGLTAIRLTLLGTTDLSFDEAHYWMWSERLAPAYFSKGPGVAFAIRASTALFGATEFGVRFWSPILGGATTLLLYYFTRRLFHAAAGFWIVLAVSAVPLFNVGNFVMTIDPLSIFFWTAAMFTFWLALERAPNFSWFWPATGLLIGIGFLCKYTNALELVSIIIVLALVPRLRREFKSSRLYSLLGVFALCTLPAVVWNKEHAWITLAHLRTRGSLDYAPGVHPTELLGFLAMHFLVFSPLLFAAVAWAVLANWRRARQQFKVLYLVWFGLPVFGFNFLLSINKEAAPNWDALAFVSLGVLASAYWSERIAERSFFRRSATAAILLGLGMSLFALDTDLLRTLHVPIPRRDPADRLRGWRAAAGAVETLRTDVEAKLGERVFVIADERDRASEISFYFQDKRVEGAGHPPVYLVESQDLINQFSFWPRYDEFVETPASTSRPDGEVYTEEGGINPFAGRSALYVQSASGMDFQSMSHRQDADATSYHLPHNIRAAFQSTEKIATVEVRRFGSLVRTWQLFLCRTYRTLPL